MAAEQSGDPGRTPGSAEGDLETIEEDLKEKGLNPDNNSSPPAQNANKQSGTRDHKEIDKVTDEQE